MHSTSSTETATNGNGFFDGSHEKKKDDAEYALGQKHTITAGEAKFSRL